MEDAEITTATVDVIVRETGRTLCTLQLLETATLGALKRAIIEQRRGTIATGLHLTVKRCTWHVIDVIIDGKVEERHRQQLQNFGILGSRTKKAVAITFLRAYAFHDRAQVK